MKTSAKTKADREAARRKKLGISNTKIEPGVGALPDDGRTVSVNLANGHGRLLAMHRQQPNTWTKPMVLAAMLFAKDYDASNFAGLRAMEITPKIDTSGRKDTEGYGAIMAKSRLGALRARIGEEYFYVMLLACGYGLTLTQMHEEKFGDKRTLSDMLRTALRKADAFYQNSKDDPPSEFMLRLRRFLQERSSKLGNGAQPLVPKEVGD